MTPREWVLWAVLTTSTTLAWAGAMWIATHGGLNHYHP